MNAEPYRDSVLEHNRSPRNFGSLAGHSHAADGNNPLCGDVLRFELALDAGRIVGVGFQGECCAIAKAAASMLSERIAGMNVARVYALRSQFMSLLRDGHAVSEDLGELVAFAPLQRYPARRQCALLPFATLLSAMTNGACATTEEEQHMTLANPDQGLAFRAAVHADIDTIVALVESAYRGEVSKAGWTTEADLLEGQRTDPGSVAELLDKAGSRVLLAEREGQLLCCCHLQAQDGSCYFGMFAVAPGLQGGGVGKAVMMEAERIARVEWGCHTMEMTVITVRDSLIAWYERRGYHRTGVRKPFPYGDEKFGIPKRNDLEFEILAKLLT